MVKSASKGKSAFAVFKGKKGGYNPNISPDEEVSTASSGAEQDSFVSTDRMSVSSASKGKPEKSLKNTIRDSIRKRKSGSAQKNRRSFGSVTNTPTAASAEADIKLTSMRSHGSKVDLSSRPPKPQAAKTLHKDKDANTSVISSSVSSLSSAFSQDSEMKVITPPSTTKRKRKNSDKENSQNDPQPSTAHTPKVTMGTKKMRTEVPAQSTSTEPAGMEERSRTMADEENGHMIDYLFDSYETSRKLFQRLIHPLTPEKFFRDIWEKKPLLVKRHMTNYNEMWFSTAELDRIMKDNCLIYGKNIDVVTYENGQRETHNPPGRAFAPVVWDYYQNGCSVRLLNPQTYSWKVWKYLSVLQEYFGSFAGANIYLTPPGSQGFAPHYDDIEAFVLQVEGKKEWKLYHPASEAETLPRFSSKNLKPDELGEMMLQTTLEPGDLLYFPRGTVHQASTPEDTHSLHITVSACQQNSWGDLLEKLLPRTLQVAMEDDIEFRKALPTDYLNYMGIVHSDNADKKLERRQFFTKIEGLMQRLIKNLPVDGAVDQMAVSCIHSSLPPYLTEAEKACSIHGSGEHWSPTENKVRGRVELEPDTKIKIVRKNALRLVAEEDAVRVYHCMENTRVYREMEKQYIEITPDAACAVEFLINEYPKFVDINSLPLPTITEKIDISTQLYEKGLLLTGEQLYSSDESDTEK